MLLLAGEHARIRLGCELHKLLVVPLDLVQLCARELAACRAATDARLCHDLLSLVRNVALCPVLASR